MNVDMFLDKPCIIANATQLTAPMMIGSFLPKRSQIYVTRNKARLIAKAYNQEEGIDFDKTFAPIARLEAIRILCAFTCLKNFKLYQMDVKSVFLNGYLNKDVYADQPPDFENYDKPNHVYKLTKALYALKQALRAWYERLSKFC